MALEKVNGVESQKYMLQCYSVATTSVKEFLSYNVWDLSLIILLCVELNAHVFSWRNNLSNWWTKKANLQL